MGLNRSAAWICAAVAGGATAETVRHDGLSMAPCLLPGDVLRLRALTAPPRPGCVLVVRLGERLVAHRLVRWRADAVVLRGDANLVDDPPVRPDAIVGVVVAAARGGRLVPLRRSLLRRALARLRHAR